MSRQILAAHQLQSRVLFVLVANVRPDDLLISPHRSDEEPTGKLFLSSRRSRGLTFRVIHAGGNRNPSKSPAFPPADCAVDGHDCPQDLFGGNGRGESSSETQARLTHASIGAQPGSA